MGTEPCAAKLVATVISTDFKRAIFIVILYRMQAFEYALESFSTV
jgi:hypothetical protein